MFLEMQIFAFRVSLRLSREMTFQICCSCAPRLISRLNTYAVPLSRENIWLYTASSVMIISSLYLSFSLPPLSSSFSPPLSLFQQNVDGVLFRALLLGGDAGHRRRRMGVDHVETPERRSRIHLQHRRSDCRVFPRQRRLSRAGIGGFLQRLLEKRTSARRTRHFGRILAVLGRRILNHYDAHYDI